MAWQVVRDCALTFSLIIFGFSLLLLTEDVLKCWHYIGLVKALGDALVIAGVLGLFVEPFLKRKLLKEAAEGVFEYILGFDLEPAIRERLKQIAFGQSLYIRDPHLLFVLERSSQNSIQISCTVDFELRNASPNTVAYTQSFIADRADFTEVQEFSLEPNHNSIGYVLVPIRRNDPTDQDTEIWESQKTLQIMPHIEGATRYRLGLKFKITASDDFYYNYVSARPMIGATVRILAPAEFSASVGSPAMQKGDQWYFPGVVMNGEKITVRWHPVKPTS